MCKQLAIKPDISEFSEIKEYNLSFSDEFLGYDKCKKVFSGMICFVQDSCNVWLSDARYSMKCAPFNENHIFYVPLKFFAASIGADFNICSDGGIAAISGIKLDLKMKNDIPYVSLADACVALGKHYFESVKGIAVVSDRDTGLCEELSVKGDQYVPIYVTMMNYIIYERPDALKIKELFYERNTPVTRPYIYLTSEKFENIKKLAKTDDVIKSWSQKIITSADEFMSSYKQEKQTFDYYTRFKGSPMSWDVMSLCWAYHMTGDEKYSDMAVDIAMHVSSFPTWSSRDHNISVCTPTDLCVAVLDFLYDKLGSKEKYTILSALYNKTVAPAFKFFSKEYQPGSPAHFRTNNWNSSANSAVVAASLAVMSEFCVDECCEAIEKSVVCLEKVLHNFAPDGGWSESLGYWGIAVSDTVQMISNLKNALGSDFSLTGCPGFSQTGYFPFFATGNAGGYAFHDTHPRDARVYAPELFWFAELGGDASLARLYRDLLVAEDAPIMTNNIIYYYDGGSGEETGLDLDKHFGKVEVATMRSDWNRDKHNVFVGMHAGYNSEI
ncbi:MAG: DUF4962 domain-containing protein, partial [Clostridia bacterium]|nr:DUF4962 domain-containing protein [Clostridia bacterium]